MKFYQIILILFTSVLSSQNKGIVYYGCIEALNEEGIQSCDNNSYMVFNNSKSYYVTAKDSLESKNMQREASVHKASESNPSTGAGVTSAAGNQVVVNLKLQTIFSRYVALGHDEIFYVSEPIPELNWTLIRATKKIGNFLCQKATTTFRGRKYTAWYTTKIAIPFGPWKLQGLPGLILEAYDLDKHIFWYFKNVEFPTINKENINDIRKSKFEKKTIFLTFEQFLNQCKKIQQEEISRHRMLEQKFKSVKLVDLKISEMFFECEK